MLRTSRKFLIFSLAILAAAFILYKFRHSIALTGFRWLMVEHALRHARIPLLLLALAAIYACYALRALRWVRMCRWLGRASFGNVYSATLTGFSCVFLLGRAGEPIRPVLIARKDSLSIPGMFGVYVLERVCDMAAAALLAGFALLSFARGGMGRQGSDLPMAIVRSAGAMLLAGLVVAVMALVYFRYHGAAWLARKLRSESWRSGWREKAAVLLEGFSDGLRGVRTWGDLGTLAFYTAVHWLLVALVYLWVIRAFPGPLAAMSFGNVVLVMAFALVGSAVQLPAVGGGAQAATFLALTLILGVEKEPAAVVSVIIWLITFAACTLAGLPLLFHEGWSMGELRRLARAEEQAGEAALLAEAEQGADVSAPGPASSKESVP